AVGRDRRHAGGAAPGAPVRLPVHARHLQRAGELAGARIAAGDADARGTGDRRRLHQGLCHAAHRARHAGGGARQAARLRCRARAAAGDAPHRAAGTGGEDPRARPGDPRARQALRRQAPCAVPRPRRAVSDRARGRAQAQGNLLHPRRRLPGRRAQARTAGAGGRRHAGGGGGAQQRPAGEAEVQPHGGAGARRRADRVRRSRSRHPSERRRHRHRDAAPRHLRAGTGGVHRAAAAARLPRRHPARHRRRSAAQPRQERHRRVAQCASRRAAAGAAGRTRMVPIIPPSAQLQRHLRRAPPPGTVPVRGGSPERAFPQVRRPAPRYDTRRMPTPRSYLPDALAGLSIAGLLLPEAVAYSGLAGLPPQAGVIALFAGLVCYGLLGRSRYAMVTATSSSAAVLASATLALGGADAATRIAYAPIRVVGTGLAFMMSGALRLGAMSSLIARPVLRGYSFGLALVIAVKQWPTLVHLPVQSGSFLPLLQELARHAGAWQLPSLGCGLAALAGLFVLGRIPRVPGALVVIVASVAASGWLAAHGVALTGPIHLVLAPPEFVLPPGAHWLPLTEFSLALMFILFAESYGSIRAFALKHDEPVQPSRDLLALGVANLVSGALQGTPVGAGYSGTAANEAAGAQSRLAGLAAAAVVLLLVVLCLPWIERIPQPA